MKPSPEEPLVPAPSLREALVEARAQIDRDRTGLAAALNKTINAAKGREWIPAGEWGSYSYEEHTLETLRKECGWLIGEVVAVADAGLRASGELANKACREIDAILSRDAALAQPAPAVLEAENARATAEEWKRKATDGLESLNDALAENTRHEERWKLVAPLVAAAVAFDATQPGGQKGIRALVSRERDAAEAELHREARRYAASPASDNGTIRQPAAPAALEDRMLLLKALLLGKAEAVRLVSGSIRVFLRMRDRDWATGLTVPADAEGFPVLTDALRAALIEATHGQ